MKRLLVWLGLLKRAFVWRDAKLTDVDFVISIHQFSSHFIILKLWDFSRDAIQHRCRAFCMSVRFISSLARMFSRRRGNSWWSTSGSVIWLISKRGRQVESPPELDFHEPSSHKATWLRSQCRMDIWHRLSEISKINSHSIRIIIQTTSEIYHILQMPIVQLLIANIHSGS